MVKNAIAFVFLCIVTGLAWLLTSHGLLGKKSPELFVRVPVVEDIEGSEQKLEAHEVQQSRISGAAPLSTEVRHGEFEDTAEKSTDLILIPENAHFIDPDQLSTTGGEGAARVVGEYIDPDAVSVEFEQREMVEAGDFLDPESEGVVAGSQMQQEEIGDYLDPEDGSISFEYRESSESGPYLDPYNPF